MKVLYLTMNPNRASTTVPTEGWFRVLCSRGLEPVLVSNETGPFHDWASEQGIPAYQIPLPFPNKFKPWPFLHSLWRLRRVIRRHGVQLIHCNEQDIYPIGGWLAQWCRLPVVVSVHFEMGRVFCEWAFGGKRRPDRVFFLTRGSRDVCRPAVDGIVPESAWALLYNGLDLGLFRPDPGLRSEFRARHGLDGALAIGNACAIRPRKQLEHLFEAAARLGRPDVRVVLAGGPVPGDEAYADRLLRDAQEKLGERFVYLGHRTELRDFYNGLDLFVNTSQAEACSISIIESLACGCPVVGYPSTSVDEQVLPTGGEIVEQDRVELLTAALDRWLVDGPRMADAKTRARARAEEAFDIRKLAGQLWDEYQTILN
jgi:glycosyltransferase involved in cell wall biosynthesis